jgi:molybdate transport system regulatory protein
MSKRKALTVKMRIRVYVGDHMLGPGKMELLEHIDATGSLAAAAKKMRMSYMRAWTLVQNLNCNPNRPMIEMSRGGVGGGTAKVTQLGKKVLALYQSMDRESTKAAGPYSRKLATLLE